MFTLTALLQCHLLITSDVQKKNESAAASVAGSDWKTDLYHYLVQFLELNALSASASTCKQLYCKFNSELVQRRLCSMMCAKVLDIPLLHYQHSAYSILRRIHPLLLARQEEVNIKCFHLGKRKRRANLHCLSLLPFHFPWPVSEYAQVNQQATSSSSHSASVPQKEVQTSSPFTLLTRDTDSCNVTARLSCIAYFEVNFTTTEKSHFAKEEQHWSIGITNYADNISSTEQLVVAYNHSGKVFKAQHCLANNPYYKFNVNDTVGCGIIYPPLSSNNRGQIFFTRNGELIHTEDLSLAETFGTAWYPFAMSGGAFQAKFNLGRKDSFLFNIHVFESLKTKHIGLSDFSFFEELFFKQPDYQRFAFPMETVITNNVILHKDSKILDMMLPVLIEIHNPLTNILNESGNESEMDFKSEDESNAESEDNNSVPISSRLSSDHSLSALPLHGILSKPSSKWMGSAFAMSWNQAMDDSKKSSTSIDVAFDVSVKRRDSKQDLDEDSMIVELSSVDSMAMNEMRDCELGSFRDQEVSEHHKFRTPLYLGSKEKKFVQLSSTRSNNSVFSSTEREEQKLVSRSFSPSHNIASRQYTALSDSGLASSWLQKATEEANIRSKQQAAKPGGDIVNANLILDGYDSDRSVATSLFVEVASVDENGSYKGYGAACEEDVVEEADVYIRGRLTKFDNTGLHFDSDESEGTCGARWDHNSHDGSEQTGNRKQKRRRSTSFLSSGKRMKLLATEEMAMPNSSSISYLAASACISSVMLDGEDGYDGASELRSYDGDFIDDHTTDNEAIHHGESMRKMQASGSTMTTMFGGSPEQDSINQSRTTASFASSATTSIYSGSPEDGCQSDQAISSPKLGHNRYAKDKKRHLK